MNFKNLSIIILGVIILISCYNENSLTPSDANLLSKFEFPQGNNSWDDLAVEIHDKLGIYVIYKDFTIEDLQKSWIGSGLAGTDYYGQPIYIKGDQISEYAIKLMKYHVFDYLNKDLISKVIPPYFFLLYDYYEKLVYIPGILELEGPVNLYTDGLDFWATCIMGEPHQGEQITLPETEEEFLRFRGRIIYKVMNKTVEKENITAPESFHDGIDYFNSVRTDDVYRDSTDYFITRGFCPLISQSFGSSWENVNVMQTRNGNLINHILCCCRYTDQEFEEIWPERSYPFIWEKRKLIKNHMKNRYNFDCEAFRIGPNIDLNQ